MFGTQYAGTKTGDNDNRDNCRDAGGRRRGRRDRRCGAAPVLRRRAADVARREGLRAHAQGRRRRGADAFDLAGGRSRSRWRLHLGELRRGRRSGGAPADHRAAVHLRNPDLGRDRPRPSPLRRRAARSTPRLGRRVDGVAGLHRRRGRPLRSRRPLLDRAPGSAEEADPRLADLERAELEQLLQAEAEPAGVREAARLGRTGDSAEGPGRRHRARRHGRAERLEQGDHRLEVPSQALPASGARRATSTGSGSIPTAPAWARSATRSTASTGRSSAPTTPTPASG